MRGKQAMAHDRTKGFAGCFTVSLSTRRAHANYTNFHGKTICTQDVEPVLDISGSSDTINLGMNEKCRFLFSKKVKQTNKQKKTKKRNKKTGLF